jgi:chromosome segregation ATPase
MPTQKRPRRAAAAKGKDAEGDAQQAAVKIRRLRNLQRAIVTLGRQVRSATRRADQARRDIALELLATAGDLVVSREEWERVRAERDALAEGAPKLYEELAYVKQQRDELQARVKELDAEVRAVSPGKLAGAAR